MICPSCGASLQERGEGLFEDIPVLACTGCDGAFYPAGSLDRLDDAISVDVEALPLQELAPTSAPCPGCRAEAARAEPVPTLTRVCFIEDGSIEALRCGGCEGSWLDAIALEALRELAVRVSSRENARLNAEASVAELEQRVRKQRGLL